MSHDAKKFWNASWSSQFADDWTLMFSWAATVFDDMLWDITRTQTVGTRVTLNNVEWSVEFTNQATPSDYIFLNTQISHKWKVGSVVYPHVHWWQNQNAVPNWLIQYRWQRNGLAQTTPWTNLALLSSAFTYTSGTLNQISYNAGWITPPVWAGLSDILQIRLIRDSQNSTWLFPWIWLYSWTVSATSIDTHIEIDMVGSSTEYTK